MTGLIASFKKNANEEVRVSLDDFRGHLLVNLRVWYADAVGEMRPGKQGLAIRLEHLPDLRKALDQVAEVERGDAR